MNVYDFDKTIYDGDSTIDFYFYCLKKRPVIILGVFSQLYGIFLYLIKKADTTQMKERFFSFLRYLNGARDLVDSFWDENQHKIKPWYQNKKEITDLVISASPEFLVAPICRRMNIQPAIATNVDIYTGKIYGRNCKGQEKVKRFFEVYPEGNIMEFYSDSQSDSPLASLSQRAFVVTGDKMSPWIFD